MISCLELPAVQDRPQLFSTFLMWLLADLFHDLPEVGDLDKPKLVFFFDEAHLLFDDATKAFLDADRRRPCGSSARRASASSSSPRRPKDVPADVLAQLGNRVQHALRAFTPDDAKALKAAISTYPNTAYDLSKLLTQLGTGEAVVTVLSEKGAPTPVAWTRMRAPQSLMAPVAAGAGRRHRRGVAAGAEVRRGRRPRVGLRDARQAPGGPPRPPRRRPHPRRGARPSGVGSPAARPKEEPGLVEQVVSRRLPLDAPLGGDRHRPRDHAQHLRHRAPPSLTLSPAHPAATSAGSRSDCRGHRLRACPSGQHACR